ncbi:uncharacterized protein LOC105355772 isoform X1 [Oryzias latipes]
MLCKISGCHYPKWKAPGRSENYSVKHDCSYHPYRDQRDREVEGVAGSIRGFAGGLQQPTCLTTVPSTSCPEQCPHKDECSRFPSLSQKPCRPTSKKSWQRALSDLLHPQLRLVKTQTGWKDIFTTGL